MDKILTFKEVCQKVAVRHGLGHNLVTGHKYSYFEEAAKEYAAQHIEAFRAEALSAQFTTPKYKLNVTYVEFKAEQVVPISVISNVKPNLQ